MSQDVNLFDPMGIAKMVRGQVNQMAVQANLPQVPDLPTLNVSMAGFPLLNSFNPVVRRPGYAREERAG